MLTTPVVAIGSAELQFKFLIAETPPDLLLNFATDLISTPLPITSILGPTVVSTFALVIHAPSD